jgi:hypothetical protein
MPVKPTESVGGSVENAGLVDKWQYLLTFPSADSHCESHRDPGYASESLAQQGLGIECKRRGFFDDWRGQPCQGACPGQQLTAGAVVLR